ncbi:MAG: anti-phage dCTP deaminase [Marivita sp.]|uniref:anti-phage dCTP deaminase n=1 Tax=Marivita sp. TaxID=2003365 RepID=UPI003EF6EED2
MSHLHLSETPELVFGLVGPLGVDMTAVQRALEGALRRVKYAPHTIHLTKELPSIFPHLQTEAAKTYREKIALVNKLRTDTRRADILALLSVLKICAIRSSLNKGNPDVTEEEAPSSPVPSNAYIIRQLKREEEIALLKRIYGRMFIQVSITTSDASQQMRVSQIVATENPSLMLDQQKDIAAKLIQTDQNEDNDKFGQRLSDTFHSGDVFVNGDSESTLSADINRFIDGLFGSNFISPTIDEFGSYMAKAAALRSIDMSRQVGAAILSESGDIISVGCNEVPKAGGGNYWCSDANPQRDMDRKIEANKLATSQIIRNFIDTIHQHGSLNKNPDELIADPTFQNLVKNSLVSDITEFGRMTHAEMAALTDAARLGRAISGATIFVTTFPCHNCAKHLVAAGIKRIVYIEPYPKSRALNLHDDAITTDQKRKDFVVLSHFHGISPRRYRDIFEKGKRKNNDNTAKPWYEDHPAPLVGDRYSSHVLFEPLIIKELGGIIESLENTPPSA